MNTIIGQPTATALATPSFGNLNIVKQVEEIKPMETFPIALSAPQQVQATALYKQVDFLNTPARDIILFGNDVEQSLHKTLDGFLDRINQGTNPQIFNLITSLKEEVDKQDLGSLADRILNAKPTFGQKVAGFFNKKSLIKAMDDAWTQTKAMADGKTKTLRTVIEKMQLQLQNEQVKLYQEIKMMDQLKQTYGVKYDEFVVVVGAISMVLKTAKEQVAELEAKTNTLSPQENSYLADQKNKLTALESRSLALEGTLVRLPADQMVIQQLIEAGITTLSETATTASARFASIKMTLITINSALTVKSVQQIAQQGANLDKNLDGVRSKLMNEVVTTAVSSIGDNRMAQAEQIRGIIQDTKELAESIVKIRAENEIKFKQVRQIFDESKQQMLQISQGK